MKIIILKSPAHARYRFGTAGLDDTAINRTSDFFHADTLFSAMVNTHAKYFANTNDFVADFQEQNIKISSGCFCFEKDGKYLFFLHKPLFLNLCLDNDESFKTFKDIRFISKGIWERGLSTEEILNAVIIGRQFACLASELLPFGISSFAMRDFKPFSQQVLPKVTINHDAPTERLFFQGSIELLEFMGLKTHYYFLQEGKDVSKSFYELLKDMGIGGELNVGCGNFDSVEIQDFVINNQRSSDFSASLSIIFPKNIEELHKASFYDTILRGGRRIGKSDGKNLLQIRGIAEGAIFEATENLGRCVDIAPEDMKKPFLRYGHGFLLPISQHWKEIIPSKS